MKIEVVTLGQIRAKEDERVACIGYFDGFHVGHRKLVETAIEESKKRGCKSAVITFEPDPWVTIKGLNKENVKHLTSMKQRQKLAEQLGLDEFLILDFTPEMAKCTKDEFLHDILVPLNLKCLVCGFDFHYGAKGQGSAQTLIQDANGIFDVKMIESVNDEGSKISTTRIENCLLSGEIGEANRCLGYPYTLEGIVIHGRSQGNKIGFPTANVQVNKEILLPATGVYIGKCIVDHQEYNAMINLGHNPTFNYVDHISVEAYILDFNRQIYGETVEIQLLKRIRAEKKFESIEQLIQQLHHDVQKVRDYAAS